MKRSLIVLTIASLSAIGMCQQFEVLYSKKVDKWEAKFTYPTYLTRDALSGIANAGASKTAKGAFDHFLKNARANERQGWQDPEWMLRADATIGVSNAAIRSMMWTAYEYTGGANGNSFFISKTYGLQGELKLSDLLMPGTDKVAFSKSAVLQKLNEFKKERGAEPIGDLSAEMAEQFVVTPAGITWLFNKYDVGSGAEGTYQVKVKWNEMPAGIDRDGLLAGLITSAENAFPIKGTLNWTGDATMPPGARVLFRVFEHIADKPATYVIEKSMPATSLGQPINFTIDKSRLKPNRQYQVEAVIQIDGHNWFRNTTAIFLSEDGDLGSVTVDPYQYPEMERPWMRLQGTVGYRERMMVPEGSIVRFKLMRASREAGNPVLAQKTMRFTGVGMLFDVTFSNSEMRSGPHYIEVTLEDGRNVMFKSDPISVEKFGWEGPPEITLKRVVNR